MAIGSPFELDQTVSAGIISGLGRELTPARRAKYLQTDAAINPGNSGGPLIDLEGNVIGINTAIATNNGSFQGIGFAIPINVAKWVTGQLIKKGSVQRAYLGVQLNEMTPALAERLGGHRGEGVLIGEVFPKTPAAEAGFEPGDIIVRFAGQKVKDRGELQALVETRPDGRKTGSRGAAQRQVANPVRCDQGDAGQLRRAKPRTTAPARAFAGRVGL